MSHTHTHICQHAVVPNECAATSCMVPNVMMCVVPHGTCCRILSATSCGARYYVVWCLHHSPHAVKLSELQTYIESECGETCIEVELVLPPVVQCVAVCCSVLQCFACSVLQCVAVLQCDMYRDTIGAASTCAARLEDRASVKRALYTLKETSISRSRSRLDLEISLQHIQTDCNTLQHTAHKTLQHTAAHCNTIQRSVCNAFRQTDLQIEPRIADT